MPITNPDSDFDRYANKQKDLNEGHKTGKNIYVKGEKEDGKTKKK